MNKNISELDLVSLENGIVVDFVNDSFVFLLKDDTWSEFEITAFLKHRMNISFSYERVCGIFFFEIVDGIEVSDASFDSKVCDDQKKLLSQGIEGCYHVEAYLIDKNGSICAQRKATLSKASSYAIYEAVKKQMETPYDTIGFDRALLKIQGVQEPFELVERAIVKESFK